MKTGTKKKLRTATQAVSDASKTHGTRELTTCVVTGVTSREKREIHVQSISV
jgi:hypothetical protein